MKKMSSQSLSTFDESVIFIKFRWLDEKISFCDHILIEFIIFFFR